MCALLVIALGCGFGPGASDFSAKLSNGYFVCRTSAHQIMIAPENGWTESTPIIPTKVVELDHDDHFVIAKQQILERRSPNNPQDTYEQPKPNAFNYWILDLRTPKAFGPLTLEEWIIERTRLGVDPKLQLHDVYDFRNGR